MATAPIVAVKPFEKFCGTFICGVVSARITLMADGSVVGVGACPSKRKALWIWLEASGRSGGAVDTVRDRQASSSVRRRALLHSDQGMTDLLFIDRSLLPVADLCLPQIKPEHIGDAVHPGSDGTERVPLSRRHVISARLCSTISECACHYSSPCRTAAHGADGVRRTPRYDRGIPCGSSRSSVLRMRFARVNAETSGGLECRLIERGG